MTSWKDLIGKRILIRKRAINVFGESELIEVVVREVSPCGRFAKIEEKDLSPYPYFVRRKVYWIKTDDYKIEAVLST